MEIREKRYLFWTDMLSKNKEGKLFGA